MPFQTLANDRNTHYQDIPDGSEIFLSCTGQRPIRWSYPDSFISDRRLDIDDGPRARSGGRHQSTLIVRDARASDTGMYSCLYEDTPDGEDADVPDFLRTKVFIFVNDWQNLLVEPKNYIASRGAMITLTQNELGIIPCVPTFSNATVTLVQVHHVGHEVQIPLHNENDDSTSSSSDFRYAPTRGGIIIPFPSKPMVGQYRCRAQVRGPGGRPLTEEMNVRVLHFVTQAKPPHPVIDRSRARHVVEGGVSTRTLIQIDPCRLNLFSTRKPNFCRFALQKQSFSLSCYVQLQLTKEPVTLEWTAPTREAQRRMQQTPILSATKQSTLEGAQEYLEVRRNFTLTNVDRRNDAGPYECSITKSGQTKRTAVDINPYSVSQTSHIYITPKNPVEIINFTTPVKFSLSQYPTSPSGSSSDRKKSSTKFLAKQVVFQAELDVYPHPPRSVYWVRNGHRIKSNDEKYNITHLPNNEHTFLRINDIDGPQDAGIYTLWVETDGGGRQSADFELRINVVPTVELHGATDARAAYVKEARDDYNVVLHTVGPQPHVVSSFNFMIRCAEKGRGRFVSAIPCLRNVP